jgi:CRISPR system Cascade subunit CasE
MIYLTQASIDYATAAKRGLRDTYDWHRAIWKAFPGCDAKPRDFLTRLDKHDDGFRLLIVSPEIPTRPDWCPEDCWQTKPIPPTYFTKRRYAFQLCANPTKKITKLNPDGSPTKNGKRVPLRTREELITWVQHKGEHGGFVVDETTLHTIPRGCEYFTKDGTRGLHSAVEYKGVLTVTAPEKFHESFMHGLGSAKAFGFGLLMIAPVLSIQTTERSTK